MKIYLPLVLSLSLICPACTGPASAASASPPSNVDYPGFEAMAKEAGKHREKRLVDVDTFLRMAKEKNTVILDSRSESAYKRKHLKGAIHLNFSDFTAARLQKLIPDQNTRILIYCNNNFEADSQNFPEKRVELALNIPTFINLYGYGYKNIYELSVLLNQEDPRLVFEGTAVKAQS